MTDTLVFLLVLFFFVNGFVKGFLRTVLGPISLVITMIAASYYYTQTQNLLSTFIIGILGPIFIRMLLTLLLSIFDIAFKNKEESISLPSRMAGALINVLWGSAYILMALFFITLLPFSYPKLQAAQEDIKSSLIYRVTNKYTDSMEPLQALKINEVMTGLQDVHVVERVRDSEEYKNLIDNPSFKEFFASEDIQQLIDKQDIKGLMNSPQIQSLLADKDALRKIMDLNKKIISEKNAEIEGMLNKSILDEEPGDVEE